MSEEVKLSRIHRVLDALEYPLSNADARAALADVTVLYADGDEALAAVVSRSDEDTFESVDDLEAEIYANLPVGAVGEPGQSEGEG